MISLGQNSKYFCPCKGHPMRIVFMSVSFVNFVGFQSLNAQYRWPISNFWKLTVKLYVFVVSSSCKGVQFLVFLINISLSFHLFREFVCCSANYIFKKFITWKRRNFNSPFFRIYKCPKNRYLLATIQKINVS